VLWPRAPHDPVRRHFRAWCFGPPARHSECRHTRAYPPPGSTARARIAGAGNLAAHHGPAGDL